MTPARRIPAVLAVVALTVALAALGAASLRPASAAPVRALEDETWWGDPAIEGRIVDASGTPLPNINVVAYEWDAVRNDFVPQLSTEATPHFTAPAVTSAEGTYTLFVPRPNRAYRLKISDPSGRYGYRYWPGSATLSSARSISVGATGAVPGCDATMVPAGFVRGTVQDPLGRTLPGRSRHEVYRWEPSVGRQPSGAAGRWVMVQSGAFNGASYIASGLASGSYRLKLYPPSPIAFLFPFWYSNAKAVTTAKDVSVTAGRITTLPRVRFIQRVGTQMRLTSSMTIVPEGTRVLFRITLSESVQYWRTAFARSTPARLPYRYIRLYSSPDGKRWTYRTSLRTSSSGTASIPTVINRTMYYKFLYAGEPGLFGVQGVIVSYPLN